MTCPECQCEEVNVAGICLWCGYQPDAVEEGETYAQPAAQSPEGSGISGPEAPIISAPSNTPLLQDDDFLRAYLSARYYKDPTLLSARCLSGAIDLGIMAVCTSLFILVSRLLSGSFTFDFGGILCSSAIFLLLYFLYSLFFLGISSQTVGMMLLNLRVVTADAETRPAFSCLVRRSCLYLASLFCAGAGLIWAYFDDEQRCFHDKLTNTRVVRI